MPPELKCPNPIASAILTEAAALHQAHMDGTEPTSEASQGRLMGLIEAALLAVTTDSEPMPDMPAR